MKWKSAIKEKPANRKTVWLASREKQTVFKGYYANDLKAFFNEGGTGVQISHWMELIKPEPPKKI